MSLIDEIFKFEARRMNIAVFRKLEARLPDFEVRCMQLAGIKNSSETFSLILKSLELDPFGRSGGAALRGRLVREQREF